LQDDDASGVDSVINYGVLTYWNDDHPPDDVLSNIESWGLSGLYAKRYSQASAEAFLRKIFGGEILDAFHYAHHPAMQADIFRLALLYAVGGLYVDADDGYINKCHCDFMRFGAGLVAMPVAYHPKKGRPIDVSEAINSRDENVLAYFNNAPVFCTPRHRLIEIALDNVLKAVHYRKKRREPCQIHNDVGPGCLTFSVLQYAINDLLNGDGFDFKVRLDWKSFDLFRDLAYKKTNRNWRAI
jgi:hypothetical protein